MANASSIPELFSIQSLYSEKDLELQNERYGSIVESFTRSFKKAPQFLARAPGRVNIIGEHIDYCGFGVLPMGIERDIVIAAYVWDSCPKAGEVLLSLASTKPSSFPPREVIYEGPKVGINIDISNHDWSNYCRAALKGVLDLMGDKVPKKMSLMIDGTIPGGGGLSSSSALVCCVSMAVTRAQGISLSSVELAALAVSSERLVGLNSGGMDQSCSMLAERGTALHIGFVPSLSAVRVPLPPVVFVVANSLVVSDKAVTGPVCYNLRVVETRMAAAILGKHLKLSLGVEPTLRDVVDALDSNITASIHSLLQVIENVLEHHEDGYSLANVCQALDINEAQIKELYFSKYIVRANTFHLYRRAKHVLSEAMRVLLFKSKCDELLKNPSADISQDLGDLMNQSQDSCRDLFDCSCPELNQLIKLCLDSGAIGSRLTGAGWGGCTISLIPKAKAESFTKSLRDNYYSNLSDDEFKKAVFATQPSQGAVFLKSPGSHL